MDNFRKRVVDGVLILEFQDDFSLDHQRLASVREELLYWIGEHRVLALNFGALKYLNSAGIGLLVQVAKRLREQQGRLALFHVPPKIEQLFRVTKVDRILTIRDSEEAALAALREDRVS